MSAKSAPTMNPPTGDGKAVVLPDGMLSLAGKYLTFRLAGQEYGIGILKVREIIGLLDVTGVPSMPSFVRGVINLRGKVIPVVDLRLKFGLEGAPDTKQTCIIVVDVKMGENAALIGILVDTVSEVINISDADVDRALDFGTRVNASFILGAAKVKGAVKMLLDIEKILSLTELTTFAGVG